MCEHVCVSYLFGGQGPRRLVLVFAEVCVFHVGCCRGGGACAQLVLVLMLVLVLVLVPVSGVYVFSHKALH